MMNIRQTEMAVGAVGMFANFTIDSRGNYLGHNGKDLDMFDQMNFHWKNLMEENIITPEEYHRTTFPQYYRTEADSLSFFENNKTLEVISTLDITTLCPYRAQYDKGQNVPDFAKEFMGTLSSWSTGVFKSALADTRSSEEKSRIIEIFFERYQQKVIENPKNHSMDYVHNVVCFSKKSY